MQTLFKRLRDLLSASECLVFFRWNFASAPTLIQRIRQCASQERFSSHSIATQATVKSLAIATWPMRATFWACQYVMTFGKKVKANTGRSTITQFVELMLLAFHDFTSAATYYRYGLYERGASWQATDFISELDASSFLRYLNRRHGHRAIDDKQAFATWCAQHRLPTAPVIATFANGRVKTGEKMLSTGDYGALFAKPACGARGERSLSWEPTADGRYVRHDGLVQQLPEVIDFLRRLSRHRTYVLQPKLTNHWETADIAPNALAAVRLVTGRYPDGDVRAVTAAFKMPRSDSITNTLGLTSPVDLETGELGKACSYAPLCQRFDLHPDTGTRIAGRRLPNMQDIVEIGVTAHRILDEYVFLGWDIALTNQNTLLLEGNSGWDVVMLQQPVQRPLLDTEFANIAEAWINVRSKGRTGRQPITNEPHTL